MDPHLDLRRKWTFRAHGRPLVFVKKSKESTIHVWSKALIWALYLPEYPDLSVEPRLKLRYKPDLIQRDEPEPPVFWGEAGQVSQRKLRWLVQRYRTTHLVFAKWHTRLIPLQNMIAKASEGVHRAAPIDLIGLPADKFDQFIDANGRIQIQFEDVAFIRMG